MKQLLKGLKKLQLDGMFRFSAGRKFVLLLIKNCEIPSHAVNDAGASVSCLSPKNVSLASSRNIVVISETIF